MFSKLAIALVATLAVFVAAAPTSNNDIKDSCNTGKAYCCNDTYESDSKEAQALKQLIGISIPANTKIGATCSPVTAIGLGSGSSCTQQPVCCTGNDFQGLVVIGCSPINVNL